MLIRAYLVSGDFRVHRATAGTARGGTAQRLRRSLRNSPARPRSSGPCGRHHRRRPRPSAPDGMASLEADTEFLPCTSGLPGE
jgi:hypothetical protein